MQVLIQSSNMGVARVTPSRGWNTGGWSVCRELDGDNVSTDALKTL